VEYLYQTKDTESYEDSDFCYDWEQNMTNCVNCGAPIETDKKVCPYCKILFKQIPARNVPESQPEKVETAIFENVVFNKGEERKNV
jgi:DNA-directed RNA polymerase subunit RPC12/RpoP